MFVECAVDVICIIHSNMDFVAAVLTLLLAHCVSRSSSESLVEPAVEVDWTTVTAVSNTTTTLQVNILK